jgi:hypothetical protein
MVGMNEVFIAFKDSGLKKYRKMRQKEHHSSKGMHDYYDSLGFKPETFLNFDIMLFSTN